ncbi:MAG: class I SAM-dependent methyltransferase [Chromatiales bacterium]|nr:class I SAM-dependent methyltransferase [Chromatiales bacterium]
MTTPARDLWLACPVCEVVAGQYFLEVEHRDYWRCGECLATFVEPSQRPSAELERTHYRLHRNDVNDGEYRKFLNQLAAPLLRNLAPGQRGLDYGCGPGPALAEMLRERGHPVALFDPCFHPDRAVLGDIYDFITCTEVAEHFHRPAEEFRTLRGLLRPGGWLAVMTSFQANDVAFATWHYRRDPTHVVFYREATFRYLARHQGWTCEFPGGNVALLRKQG